MQGKKEQLEMIEKVSVFLLGAVLLLFPLTFSTLTTDPFSLPKEIILFIGAFGTLLLLGVKFVVDGSVKIRRTPFDLPLVIFTIVSLASSILAVNQSDAIQTFIPLFLCILIFFSITNLIRKQQDLQFLVSAFALGGVILSLISVLSYAKIYALPFSFARTQTFSPLGSLFDQGVYLLIVLSVLLYFVYPLIQKKALESKNQILLAVFAVIIALGIGVSAVGVIKLQPTQILPYETGFQTALSSISQDSGRLLKSFALGSGVGTYFTDFTRFKTATFNSNQNLWTVSFFRSSSFLLELLATTGVLGFVSYLFIIYRVIKTKPIFWPAVLAIGLSVIVPFGLTSLLLIFVVLGIFSAFRGLKVREKYQFFDIELHLVAFKKGLFALSEPDSRETSPQASKALSILGLAIIAVVFLLVGFYTVTFAISDITFQKSFTAVSQNNGSLAYDQQTKAISYFPNRDGYQRIFSQLNLSIANNLASSVPQGSSPSAQQQQTIYTLIQQSINSARLATTISPQTVTNWQNLSSIYRSLIGFGQNADTFAILAAQQAAALDPTNPQEYITLGGIFYQLGQWDNAITQFQTAANLKPDYSNAYYNLGHALEQKGDLKAALTQYETVRSLVGSDKANLDKINSEIQALQDKIGSAAQAPSQASQAESSLNVNQPQVQLPPQQNPVKIPPPVATPSPTPSPTPSATPAESPTPTPTP